MQAPQSMQSDPSHSAFSFTIFKAETGQTSMQAAHPIQVSLSILTAILCLQIGRAHV